MSAGKLDAAAGAKVIELALRPETIGEKLAQLRAHDPTEADLARLDRRLAEVDRRRANAIRNANTMDDPEDAAPFLADVKQLAAQRLQLGGERAGLLTRREGWERAQARHDDLSRCVHAVGGTAAAQRGARLGYRRLSGVRLDAAAFRGLRMPLEQEWVPAMCRSVGLDETGLPALWDADFMFGPMDSTGKARFILCEINASCVSPFPKEAPARIAEYVLERVQRSAVGP